jgi:taurine dioxygenase
MNQAADTDFETEPASGALGLFVSGLDLNRTLDTGTVARLRSLLLEKLVLLFPDQHLSPEAQRRFLARFGGIEKHTERPQILEDSDEEVVIVSPAGGISAVWHCDYEEDFLPCGICSLNMVKCAADGGGDTIFVNAYRIYESFSDRMRELLDTLTAIHRNTGNQGRKRDEAQYPLVGIHPETGRRGLFYSAHHVQGFVELLPEESSLILDALRERTQRPAFALRHHWRPGTIALWDNRAIQHYVVPDFAGDRLLYQVTVRAPLLESVPGYVAPTSGPLEAVSEVAAR